MGLVLEGNGLAVGGEDHLVLPHHVAHPQGVDANLVGLALVLAVAAKDILRVRPLGLYRVSQRRAVPLGASAFRLWWASTISTSQPPKMAAA